jgi:transposase
MSTLWVGIDVAKVSLAAAAVWQTEHVQLGEFSNDPAGFTALAAAVPWVVEPTGGYELPLVSYAHEQGCAISLPNPRQVRQWAKGSGQRAKTDRQDALLLARFGAAQQPTPYCPLAIEVSELDSLLQRRQDLDQMIQQEKNRMEALQGRPGIAPPVIANLQRVLQVLQEALQEVEETIAEHQRQHAQLHADAQRLLALPGIGPKVVLALLVLLHRWKTLTTDQGTTKRLTAFVDLDPQPYESGRSVRRRLSISKMGNANLRRLLYMGALSVVHGQRPLHAFYERLVGRCPQTLGLGVGLFSRQTPWNPDFHAV